MSSRSRVSRYGRVIVLAAAVAMGSLFSSQASAQAVYAGVPSQCSAKPQRAQKYQSGLTKGQQKADELFASSEIGKSPQKLQKKIFRVLERLHGNVIDAYRSEASDGRRCRVQGVADGFLSHIVQLLGQCILDGAQWGQFAADVYCQLSLELGGLAAGDSIFIRSPVGLCGSLFETACGGTYAYVATECKTPLSATVAKFVSDRGVTLTAYPGCKQYTEGAFASVFQSSVDLDCAYAP